MTNAIRLMRQALEKAHHNGEDALCGDIAALERATVYAAIVQAEMLTRIAQALESLADCIDKPAGALVVKEAEQALTDR